MRRYLSSIALVILSIISGCDSTETEAERVSLEPGTVRVYAYRNTVTDSTGAETVFHADTLRMRVVAAGRSVEGLEGLTEVEYESAATGDVARVWYRPDTDRLIEFAYEGFSHGTSSLKEGDETARRPLHVLAGAVFDGEGGVELTVREDPRIVLEYPLEPGRTWVSFTDPFLSERRIERSEQVRVPAGTFETTVVSTTVSLVEEGFEWFDWLDAGGLVSRRISSPLLRRDENGQIVGAETQVEEVSLLAVE